jgi:hypothetical protein
MPSSASVPGTSGLKYRLQSKETLVLSDYTTRNDVLLLSTDSKMTRIFQGAGLVSTWRLELPKALAFDPLVIRDLVRKLMVFSNQCVTAVLGVLTGKLVFHVFAAAFR